MRWGRLELFAGTSRSGERGDGGPALDATIFGPAGLAHDGAGNLLVADWGDGRIRRIKPDGAIESYGTAPPRPFGFAVDRGGNAYVASNGVIGTRVYRIAADGTGTIVAGSGGFGGYAGDGGPAIDARFGDITALAFGPDGSLYLLEGRRIRHIDPMGIVTTVAGTGRAGYPGEGGTALDADLGDSPMYLVAGPAGSLYLATDSPSTVRKLTPIPYVPPAKRQQIRAAGILFHVSLGPARQSVSMKSRMIAMFLSLRRDRDSNPASPTENTRDIEAN